MKVDEWIEQAAGQRSDEIREECGTDADLQDAVEELLDSLEGEVKEKVERLVNRMENMRLQDNTNIYRMAFRDGVRYIVSVMGKFSGDIIEE